MNSHCFCLAHPTHQHCYPQTERLCVSTHTYINTYKEHRNLFRNQLARQGHPAPCAQQGGCWGPGSHLRPLPEPSTMHRGLHPKEEAPLCLFLTHTKVKKAACYILSRKCFFVNCTKVSPMANSGP